MKYPNKTYEDTYTVKSIGLLWSSSWKLQFNSKVVFSAVRQLTSATSDNNMQNMCQVNSVCLTWPLWNPTPICSGLSGHSFSQSPNRHQIPL